LENVTELHVGPQLGVRTDANTVADVGLLGGVDDDALADPAAHSDGESGVAAELRILANQRVVADVHFASLNGNVVADLDSVTDDEFVYFKVNVLPNANSFFTVSYMSHVCGYLTAECAERVHSTSFRLLEHVVQVWFVWPRADRGTTAARTVEG
jgi:hypothetical protein